MPQRRKVVEEEGSSLDSLMDALTNVVAVLIFVLLLVNCEVSQKVVKMMEDLVPASPEEIQKLKDMLKQLELDKKKLEELKKLPPPPKVDLDSINKKISALQALIKDRKSAIDMNNKNIAELQKLCDEKLAARDAEQVKANAMMEEIANLEAMLDTTPVAKDIPATEITIPAVRPVPEDAEITYVFIKNNRIHVFNRNEFIDTFSEKIKPKIKDLLAEKTAENDDEKSKKVDKSNKTQEIPVLDRDKFNAFLKAADFKLDSGINMRFLSERDLWNPSVEFLLRFDDQNGGTPLEILESPNPNMFTTALSKIKRPQGVVMFRVSPDSLLTYARAREIVEKKNIPCGWELTSKHEHLPDGTFKSARYPHEINDNLNTLIRLTADPALRPKHDSGPRPKDVGARKIKGEGKLD